MDFLPVDLDVLVRHLLKLVGAFLLTLPVAWNREKATQAMGLRTFPLVSVASCGFVRLGQQVLADAPDAQARIIAGLMTGIGFIGGGAIIKYEGSVYGTATAASIWGTGLIGAAVAYGRYEIAVLVSLLNFGLLIALQPLKANIQNNAEGHNERPGTDPNDD